MNFENISDLILILMFVVVILELFVIFFVVGSFVVCVYSGYWYIG